ncbi:MAG TPA: bifunctional 2-polyprenyl-6-hydroxyphenol methylase/3-demethylubiquinol 3-O-methyltransferase UbiG, partial [Rhabdochlamydiaceae bacterium]
AHPIALLRAENRLRNPWIHSILEARCPGGRILDVGCGAGFLTNYLASRGFSVHGVDLSPSTLEIAEAQNITGTAEYKLGNADALPYPNSTFDAVTAMDLLEHVENPEAVIAEASRVLKPGGLFFFHTFNRTPLSYLLIIKGVEWCVRNTPERLHIYPLFIKPEEMKQHCEKNGLQVETLIGVRPEFSAKSVVKMLATRKVCPDFAFKFTRSLATGYSGFARKLL